MASLKHLLPLEPQLVQRVASQQQELGRVLLALGLPLALLADAVVRSRGGDVVVRFADALLERFMLLLLEERELVEEVGAQVREERFACWREGG